MFQVVRETWALAGKRVQDYALYTGALGTAFLLFKAYQITNNRDDLNVCSEIVKACDSASATSGYLFFFPLFSLCVCLCFCSLNRLEFYTGLVVYSFLSICFCGFLLAPSILYWILRISWEQRSWCGKDDPGGIFLRHLLVLIKLWHIDLKGEDRKTGSIGVGYSIGNLSKWILFCTHFLGFIQVFHQ